MSEHVIIQDLYPDDLNHCYGCGQLNDHGLRLRGWWEDGQAVTDFDPLPFHTALPGLVYGGLLASLVDCHSIGAAAVALHLRDGGTLGDGPLPRCVTGKLEVNYLAPTPLGPPLRVVARPVEVTDRKVVLETTIHADGQLTVRGSVIGIRVRGA